MACLQDPLSSSLCKNREIRNINKSVIRNTAEEAHDEYGVLKMKMDDLKFELRGRGPRVGGRRKDLIDRLIESIEGEYGDGADD